MGHTNVEIKARCSDQQRIKDYLKDHGADFKGIDHQIDTYFRVPKGRLKLREGNIENYLVQYQRADQAGPKEALVILYRSDPDANLKEVLTHALDVLVVVDKQREIAFIDNVKFHLDTVTGLGTFMEIEAIDRDGSIGKEKLYEQCQKYLREMNIDPSDLLEGSYSDLLMEAAN